MRMLGLWSAMVAAALTLLLVFTSVLADPGWTATDLGTGRANLSIHFPTDNLVGYVVGEGGFIAKTVDGGSSWVTRNSGVTVTLRSVYMTSNDTGYAAGDAGVILRTTNGGATWTRAVVDPAVSFRAIQFPGRGLTGYAVGSLGGTAGIVFKTTDGGATWTTALLTNAVPDLKGVDFPVSPSLGYVCCGEHNDGKVFKTTDSGATWDVVLAGLNYVAAIDFVDDDTGYVAAGGSYSPLYKTVNGGASWSTVGAPASTIILSLAFLDARTGYAGLGGGTVQRTLDGGLTWNAEDAAPRAIRSLSFPVNATTGFAAADGGFVARGTNLAPLPTPTPTPISTATPTATSTPAPGPIPPEPDYPIPGGHFYTQANGCGGCGGTGYSIVDDPVAPFWFEFRRLGWVPSSGYPASRRFIWDGFVSQTMQKQVFQWRPEVSQVYFVNAFDELSRAGKDGWLMAFRQVPPPFDTSPDTGLSWDEVVARHLGFLDADPAIKAIYLADPDPIAHFGLPMSYADFGSVFVVRGQRAVLQHWKVDVPWARAGEVTIANGGDILKEVGLIPAPAVVPEPPSG